VNEGRITIGDRCQLAGEPVASHLWAQDGGTIEIGDDVRIAHGSGITARGLIRIGSGTRLGAFVLAMDTDYHVAGNPSAAAEIVPLHVGCGVFIGNRVTLLRGSVIGDGARVLDGSVVRGVVAEGQVVEGVPARAVHTDDATLSGLNSPEVRVLRLAQATFRLRELPNLSDGPDQIEGWDSLGVLSFVLAMEDEFGVLIGEDRIAGISCLGDATAMVASSLEARRA
jgi:acetyltransferase-like isoleucine patch superfamily enzyme